MGLHDLRWPKIAAKRRMRVIVVKMGLTYGFSHCWRIFDSLRLEVEGIARARRRRRRTHAAHADHAVHT